MGGTSRSTPTQLKIWRIAPGAAPRSWRCSGTARWRGALSSHRWPRRAAPSQPPLCLSLCLQWGQQRCRATLCHPRPAPMGAELSVGRSARGKVAPAATPLRFPQEPRVGSVPNPEEPKVGQGEALLRERQRGGRFFFGGGPRLLPFIPPSRAGVQRGDPLHVTLLVLRS